ncbi:MAG: hypothetical protein ACRD5L_17105, partial [Bryobacteraceae bacterium]
MNKLIAISGIGVLMAGAAAGQACDRACLEGFVDQYMDALIAHDPAKLPVTPRMKMTENGQRLEPGDGFWRTATAKGTYRLFVDDPQTGQVAFIGTMREANIPVVAAIRLKIQNRQVSEIETFVIRNMDAANKLDMMAKPNPVFLEAISTAQRASRNDLIKIANLYFSGLEKNDGKGNYPFTDDCNRIENGVQTTNNPNFRTSSLFSPAPAGGGRGRGKQAPPAPPPPEAVNPAALGCKAGLETGYFHFITRIRDRRFVAVDQERGLVFSFVFVDQASGKAQRVKLADGREITAGPKRPWTWELAEMFK